jgi:hypothetical protein
MADAEDLKSSEGSLLWVQVPPAPQEKSEGRIPSHFFFLLFPWKLFHFQAGMGLFPLDLIHSRAANRALSLDGFPAIFHGDFHRILDLAGCLTFHAIS